MKFQTITIFVILTLGLAQVNSVDWTGTWIFQKTLLPLHCDFKDNKLTTTQRENTLVMIHAYVDHEICGPYRNKVFECSTQIPTTGNVAAFEIYMDEYIVKFSFIVDGDKATIKERDNIIEFEREKRAFPFIIITLVLLTIIAAFVVVMLIKKKKDAELVRTLALDD